MVRQPPSATPTRSRPGLRVKAGWLLPLILWWAGGTLHAAQELQSFQADYQLLADGQLVGMVFTRLSLDQENYNYEVATLPAGSSRNQANALEVLEGSQGQLREDGPVPESYYYSVSAAGQDKAGDKLQMLFLWPQKQLLIRHGEEAKKVSLAKGSQDHLSYLLRGMQLILDQERNASFPVVSPEATQPTRLKSSIRRTLRLPAGKFLSMKVERYQEERTPDRTLWFDTESGILTLLEQKRGEGSLRMELVKYRPSQ